MRERAATSETENLYFKCKQIVISIALNNWGLFFTMKSSVKFVRLWFDQIWQKNWIGIGICEHDLGKTYFVEINLSGVKGSGFEILINWLSEAAPRWWATVERTFSYKIRQKLEFLGWKMTKAISVRLERPNTGSLQLCKLFKYIYRIKKTSLRFISRVLRNQPHLSMNCYLMWHWSCHPYVISYHPDV